MSGPSVKLLAPQNERLARLLMSTLCARSHHLALPATVAATTATAATAPLRPPPPPNPDYPPFFSPLTSFPPWPIASDLNLHHCHHLLYCIQQACNCCNSRVSPTSVPHAEFSSFRHRPQSLQHSLPGSVSIPPPAIMSSVAVRFPPQICC